MKRRWATLLVVPLLAFAVIACDDEDQEDLDEAFDDARTQVTEGVDDARTQVTDGADDLRTEVAEQTDDEDNEEGGAEGQPGVEITAPDPGDTPDGSVTVEVDVSSFDVVDKLGEPAQEGEGHVHFYLDVAQIPTTPGQPAVTAEGTYHAEATTSHTWEDLTPGEHTFSVQLVNNDHTPLDPPVTAQVKVTVE